MHTQIYAAFQIFLFILHLIPPAAITAAEPPHHHHKPPSSPITSNSVLVALLDSHYTELSKLIEKSLLLQTLEQSVSSHNITIFAPTNEALVRHLDPDFKRFLLEPENLKWLQNLLLFHVVPYRVGSNNWGYYETLCTENRLWLTGDNSGEKVVGGLARVTRPDDVVRDDGLIHGIEGLLVPRVVQEEFDRRRRSLRLPEKVAAEQTTEKPAGKVAPPAAAAKLVAKQDRGKAFGQHSQFTRRLEEVQIQHGDKVGIFKEVSTQEKSFLLFFLFFTSFVFIICGWCYYE